MSGLVFVFIDSPKQILQVNKLQTKNVVILSIVCFLLFIVITFCLKRCVKNFTVKNIFFVSFHFLRKNDLIENFDFENLLKMNFLLYFIIKWGWCYYKVVSLDVLQGRASIIAKWGRFFVLQSGAKGITK